MSEIRDNKKILPAYWQILDAAKELFAERGYRDTTVRLIAKKAGVNGASVNYYFRSKDSLYETIFSEAFEKVSKPQMGLVASVKDQATWAAAVDSWVRFMLELILSEQRIVADPKIVARERTMPIRFCEDLFEEFFKSFCSISAKCLKMAMPDAEAEELHAAFVSFLWSVHLLFEPKSPMG